MNRQLTAIIEREGKGYVSLCPEVDVASQGDTIDEARKNLCEALELFFETASTIITLVLLPVLFLIGKGIFIPFILLGVTFLLITQRAYPRLLS